MPSSRATSGATSRSLDYGALTAILLVGDTGAAAAAALIAPELWAAFDPNFVPTEGLSAWQFVSTAAWVAGLRVFRAGDIASGHFGRRTLSAVVRTLATVGALTFGTFFLTPFFVPRGTALVGIGTSIVLLLLWRSLYLQLLARQVPRRRVAIVGTDSAALRAAQAMLTSKQTDYDVRAFLTPDESGPAAIDGIPVVPLTSGLWAAVATLDVDQLVVGHTSNLPSEVLGQLVNCFEYGVQAVPATVKFEELTGRVMAGAMEADWYADLPTYAHGAYGVWKRLFEIVAVLVSIPIVVPFCALIAVAIYADSGGPILYRQARVGRRGVPFVLHKFRSMRNDAEPEGRAVWANQHDERVTRVGGRLRRSRLDEIPQLWNVLLGEMSLVGPRPERPEFVERLVADLPLYRARTLVRPGITGWAQVQFPYAASVEDNLAKLEYDLYYIRHVGWILDVGIALRTLPIVLKLGGR